MKAVALLLALFAFAAPVRSQVHTVGPPGSGADFTTIQAAIDAASPGDTVLVSAGSFPGFSLSKPLLVVGAGSGATTLTSIYPFGTAVSVSGVPAGEVAAVSGMAFQPAAFAFLGTGLEVNQNDGTVVLHDLASLNDDFGQLEVNVTERLVGSRLDLTSDGLPGATLRAYTSRVWFVDSGFKKAIMGPFGWSTPVSTARFAVSYTHL